MPDATMPTYKRGEEVFVRGSGTRLFDQSGRAFLDFLSGIGVNCLGHAHPRLTEELGDQLARLVHVSNLYWHEHAAPAADELTRMCGLASAFFCNSGTEALEAALKIARKHHFAQGAPRARLVALEHGFHGRTAGSLAITANPRYREPFAPLAPATFVAPCDADALRAAMTEGDAPAALVLEPVQGEGGLRPLDADFLRTARALCDESGALLIHDEVQCGVGRTGDFLAGDAAGVKPDLVCLAKPLAAGLPIGAVVASEAYAETLQPGDHGSTFGGGALALRAARVVLDELESGGLLDNVRERGAELAAGFEALAASSPLAEGARGRGLMQGLVVPGRAADLVRAAHERGLLCASATPDVLRVLPPYTLSSADVAEALVILADAMQSLQA